MSNNHSHCNDHCEQSYQQCVSQSEYSSSSSHLLCVLPPELVIYNILPHLTYIDLCSLSQVNKTFKTLIDTNDQLWTDAIKNEMLDGPPPLDEKVFENEKLRFQCLYERRKKEPWKCVHHTTTYGLQ
ncbi:unnamed protein product [Rotaria sordida]|uniref:F-box domain-containing protein n=1 Tax=Rotaria sordida TaxID=392033 RepID=A0A819NZE9_9BILA|nr:unnamed protein product [Rotaria sordida]CAF4002042.1 unnamed protein product [Rotaria sordida]